MPVCLAEAFFNKADNEVDSLSCQVRLPHEFGASMRCFPFILIASLLSSVSHGAVEVSAWSRATPPGAGASAVYGRFTNLGGESLTLISVSVDFADHAMVHDSSYREGIASMREGKLVIPAASTVELKPGGKHIMLMGLDRSLLEGCAYSFWLTWSNGLTSSHRFLTGGLTQMLEPRASEIKSC